MPFSTNLVEEAKRSVLKNWSRILRIPKSFQAVNIHPAGVVRVMSEHDDVVAGDERQLQIHVLPRVPIPRRRNRHPRRPFPIHIQAERALLPDVGDAQLS